MDNVEQEPKYEYSLRDLMGPFVPVYTESAASKKLIRLGFDEFADEQEKAGQPRSTALLRLAGMDYMQTLTQPISVVAYILASKEYQDVFGSLEENETDKRRALHEAATTTLERDLRLQAQFFNEYGDGISNKMFERLTDQIEETLTFQKKLIKRSSQSLPALEMATHQPADEISIS